MMKDQLEVAVIKEFACLRLTITITKKKISAKENNFEKYKNYLNKTFGIKTYRF